VEGLVFLSFPPIFFFAKSENRDTIDREVGNSGAKWSLLEPLNSFHLKVYSDFPLGNGFPGAEPAGEPAWLTRTESNRSLIGPRRGNVVCRGRG